MNCTLSTFLSRAANAKNSQRNFHGFSPNQLVFGQNPNFPCIFPDKLPALEVFTTSKIVAQNLNAMHCAK